MRRLGLLLLALTLTACGSGSGDSKSDAKSAKDVAAVAGCTSTYKDAGSDKMMFATDGGTCTVSGSEVTLSWFNSTTARNNYTDAAAAGGGGDPIVVGSNWVIECTDLQVCQAVAKKTGKKVS